MVDVIVAGDDDPVDPPVNIGDQIIVDELAALREEKAARVDADIAAVRAIAESAQASADFAHTRLDTHSDGHVTQEVIEEVILSQEEQDAIDQAAADAAALLLVDEPEDPPEPDEKPDRIHPFYAPNPFKK